MVLVRNIVAIHSIHVLHCLNVGLPCHLQFNSATYYTKQPTGDPDVTLSTPEEYLSHLDEFVGASFHMAEMLEDGAI